MVVSLRFVPALIGLCLLTGCALTPKQSLFEALGGHDGIAALVDTAVEHSVTDPRFGELFANTDQDRLRTQLADQICELSGGPCVYQGLSMAEAHSGMQITPAEFNWFVEHTRLAMTERGYPVGTQNRLLALLAPMRSEVLGDPDQVFEAEPEPEDPLGME